MKRNLGLMMVLGALLCMPAQATAECIRGWWSDSSGGRHYCPPDCGGNPDCGAPSGSTSSGTGDGGYYVPQGPSPAELERRRQQEARQQEATRLNKLGIDYWNRRNWEKAADYFRKALSLNPTSETIRGNLQRAQAEVNRVKREEAEAAARSLRAEAEIRVDRELDNLDSDLSRLSEPGSSETPDMEFKLPVKPPRGIKPHKRHEDQRVDMTPRETLPGAGESAGAQLKSVEKSGRMSVGDVTDEMSVGKSGLGFDTPGYKAEPLAVPSEAVSGTPAEHQTLMRIQKGFENNVKVKRLKREWEKLERKYQKIEKERKEVEEQLVNERGERERGTGRTPNLMKEYKLKEKRLKLEYEQKFIEKKQEKLQEKANSYFIDAGEDEEEGSTGESGKGKVN